MVIELTTEEQQRLTAMAADLQRSEEEVAREAMHWFLAPDDTHSEKIARARKQVAEGRTIDHDALFAELDQSLR